MLMCPPADTGADRDAERETEEPSDALRLGGG